ncbi:uncharacterized protein TNCV_437051 [Trichonephila clavipes]|nr:uncharacterized protein TNCV_437051 [Trichonephila clavipes]
MQKSQQRPCRMIMWPWMAIGGGCFPELICMNYSSDSQSDLYRAPGVYDEKIELREDLKIRRGLAVSLEIICHNCEESTSTMSSKISNKCYDVNLRLTYGMRSIGKGGAAARIFCGLMNLPPPPAKFERHNSFVFKCFKKQLVKTR